MSALAVLPSSLRESTDVPLCIKSETLRSSSQSPLFIVLFCSSCRHIATDTMAHLAASHTARFTWSAVQKQMLEELAQFHRCVFLSMCVFSPLGIKFTET